MGKSCKITVWAWLYGQNNLVKTDSATTCTFKKRDKAADGSEFDLYLCECNTKNDQTCSIFSVTYPFVNTNAVGLYGPTTSCK